MDGNGLNRLMEGDIHEGDVETLMMEGDRFGGCWARSVVEVLNAFTNPKLVCVYIYALLSFFLIKSGSVRFQN